MNSGVFDKIVLKRKDAKVNADSVLLTLALLYLILPILIFCFGWIKWYLAAIFSLVLIYFGYRFVTEYMRSDDEKRINLNKEIFNKGTAVYWSIVTVISAVWTYLSGIGGVVFQNDDFYGRNPMYRDLCEQPWPFIIDLSKEADYVQNLCGSSKVGFIYYFTWWLPSSLISKLLNATDGLRNFLLWLWAFIGVLLVMYLLTRAIGKCSYAIPVVLVIFSGLDVIPYYNINKVFPTTEHMEWWPQFFQYSSNTTLLFWVFNQTIPIWLIMGLILSLKDNKYAAAVCALGFAYSPWATVALCFYALAASIKKDRKILNIFNVSNIAVPLIMLLIFGSFYMSGTDSSSGFYGLIFNAYPGMAESIVDNYVRLVVWEFGIYLLVLWADAAKQKYYVVTVAELLLIPLIMIRDYNFFLRGSIPALFMLTFYVIGFISQKAGNPINRKVRKVVLIVVLCIGYITPYTEMSRCITATVHQDSNLIKEAVYSFADMKLDSEGMIQTYRDQFFAYDYEDKPFFKYLAK